ncbi:MAG: NUDIX domain-containing protein, partial [Gammaproteobacteria bacterium]|nr:NUDIX domain-containing protein [Gammaproteobacteria bacterium]
QIAIVGHDKDDSTYYLKGFPEWGFVAVENYHSLNATEIRNAYLEGRLESDSTVWNHLPKPTQDFLQQFKRSEGYLYLTEEYACIRKRQKSWQPGHFPVIYTTDAVVICQQKLLLIRRKYFPGKGLWALPGGHLESGESIEHGVFRELLEETQLAVSEGELRAGLKMVREFAHPNRSTVGRIVTHAGLILLNRHALPQVHAADDADDVRWHSLNALDDLLGQLHDDHYQIVRTLLKDNKILME